MPASCDQLSEVKDTRQLDDFSSLFDTNFKKRVGHDALVPYCVVCPGNFVVDGITGLLSVTKYRCRNLCTVTGCEISPDRCKPYGSVPYCNSTSDKCYCLKYQCNNKEKNCSATVCREFERAECVLNKFGTSCKCIPLITTPYCNTGNTTCHLSNVDQADTHYFNGICQNLGSDYYAETCRRNGECRCVNTSPPCTVHGCESSVLRCGPEQTVPYCNATSNQCYCLKYQCDNLHKNCSATVCGPLERPECIFDEYGTSCKCVSFLDQCGLIGLPVCSSIVSRTDRQHYDNICQQLGSSYYAVECRGMRKCRCVERIDGCRQNSDCRCPIGMKSDCIEEIHRCSRCREKLCSSNEDCTQRCPAGQISACGTGSSKCSSCAKNCSSDSECTGEVCPTDKPLKLCSRYRGCYCDANPECTTRDSCPSCPNGLKETCRRDGTCGCVSQAQCTANEDCWKENGSSCTFFSSPSCCWRDCSGSYSCRCISDWDQSALGCASGGRGNQQYTNC